MGELHLLNAKADLLNAKVERMKDVTVSIESGTDDVKAVLSDILAFQQEQLNHQERKLEWIGSKLSCLEMRQNLLSANEHDVVRLCYAELYEWMPKHDEQYLVIFFDSKMFEFYRARLSNNLRYSARLEQLIKLHLLHEGLSTDAFWHLSDKLSLLDGFGFWANAAVSSLSTRDEVMAEIVAVEAALKQEGLPVPFGAINGRASFRPIV